MKMPIFHRNSFLKQIYVQSVSKTKLICHHHTCIPIYRNIRQNMGNYLYNRSKLETKKKNI